MTPEHPKPDVGFRWFMLAMAALVVLIVGYTALVAVLWPSDTAQAGQPDARAEMVAEWRSLDRRAERHLEMAIYHLDEFDRLVAEMARVGYRIRRHDDATPPVIDLGDGP